MAFSRWLKLECRSLQESISFAVILGYLSLHVLAYAVFLGKSDWPWYVFAVGCLISTVWILVETLRNRRRGANRPDYFYFLIYGLLVVGILIYYYHSQQQGRFVWNTQEKLFEFVSDWDDLHHVSMVNESRHRFLPEDNPFLPGEPPFYHSWLGNLLPSFLVKCLGIDQIHAYYLWTPCFFYTAFMLFVHHLVRRFSEDKWAPLMSLGLFFLTPELGLGRMPVRSMAGVFLVFATVIFMSNYFSSRRKTDLVLSFNWFFLYGVKGNFLPALFPGLATFYIYALFKQRKWNTGVFNVFVVCSLIPLFLFWMSRTYFGVFYLPDPQPFVFEFSRVMGKMRSILLPLLPLLAVFAFYHFKNFKKREPFSPLETTLWCGLAGFVLFSSLAGKHLEGGVKGLIYLGLAVAFPAAAGRFIAKPALFRSLGGACVLLLAVVSLTRPVSPEGPVPMTEDDLAMIRFIRQETPEDSVILYNVYRYNDRPAVLSSLTYRKSFIDEGERFANTYTVILERRLYDYWDFLLCDCTREDREYFFAKYPQLDYVVEYDRFFLKKINPLVGLPPLVQSIPLKNKDPDLFREVFHHGLVTVYKVNRQAENKL